MTDQELAAHLGLALNALGRVEGHTMAIMELVERELGNDYFSEEFRGKLKEAVGHVKGSLMECYKAVGAGVIIEGHIEQERESGSG